MGKGFGEVDEDRLRDEVIGQLRESLEKSREMMLSQKLDAKARERWTQIHTNTAQALNQVLRDRQGRDWEKRLKRLEAEGIFPRRTRLGTRLYLPPERRTKKERIRPAGIEPKLSRPRRQR